MKWYVVCGMLLTAAGLTAAPATVLTDDSAKNNYGFGKETQIRSIEALAQATGSTVTQETPYIVLLSDFHIYDKKDAGKAGDVVWSKDIPGDLEKLVALLNDFRPAPALVVVNGDIAHNGTAEQYESFQAIFGKLNPAIPVLALPGNQDNRENMNRLLNHAWTAPRVRSAGNWTLIGLDSGTTGTLARQETRVLAQVLAQAPSRPAMIFTHHTPMQQPGWEPVRTLRETLVNAVEKHPGAIWFVSGHAHANFLARMRYDKLPDYPVLTHTSGSSSYGYDAPALRVIFLGRDKVTGSAIWRYRDASAGFRIDPPESEWPIYAPTPRDPNRELLDIGREKQKELAVERKGVGEHAQYDYVDGDGRLLLALPAAEYGAQAPLTLELDLESDYVVRAGDSETSLKEIFNSGKRAERKALRWTIPADWCNGIVYVEIRDRTPQDGFGAFIHGIRLLGSQAR